MGRRKTLRIPRILVLGITPTSDPLSSSFGVNLLGLSAGVQSARERRGDENIVGARRQWVLACTISLLELWILGEQPMEMDYWYIVLPSPEMNTAVVTLEVYTRKMVDTSHLLDLPVRFITMYAIDENVDAAPKP